MKRSFDLITATIAILILLPFLLLTALLIMVTMPGPVLFCQTRIGYKGLPFRIFKFRTMTINKSVISITLSHDERITPFGRLLRASKVDELPQLFNILKGDMSVVGPRPDVPGYSDKLEREDRMIWTLRPGLTGLDSISYPFEEELLAGMDDPGVYYDQILWPDKVRLNVWYARNRTFLLDMKIIVNTITLLFLRKHIVKIQVN